MKNYLALFCIFVGFTANAQLEKVNYKDGSQNLEGFYAKAKKTKKEAVGVVVLSAWMGIDDHSKSTATALAALGYTAFVADIYGVNNNPKTTAEAGKLAGFYKNNVLEYQKRIQLAIDQLVSKGIHPNNIAIIGYCFGGTGALEAARANLKVRGVVSFHGGLGKEASRETTPIKTKVLVLHGADDPYVPQTEVASFQEEMRKATADWQMIFYANSVHAFTHKNLDTDNSKGAAYNALADKRSWEAMKTFFAEIF